MPGRDVTSVRLYGFRQLHVASVGWLCMLGLKANMLPVPCTTYVVVYDVKSAKQREKKRRCELTVGLAWQTMRLEKR